MTDPQLTDVTLDPVAPKKRGRGRPPGAKNKKTIAREASSVSMPPLDPKIEVATPDPSLPSNPSSPLGSIPASPIDKNASNLNLSSPSPLDGLFVDVAQPSLDEPTIVPIIPEPKDSKEEPLPEPSRPSSFFTNPVTMVRRLLGMP